MTRPLAKCNPQSQSPLFCVLPKELRDLIFAFATAPYEDNDKKYANTAYFCRSGHTACHRICTDLLLTCRRIWLEANALPMKQAEHTFWFQRGPYDRFDEENWSSNIIYERMRYSSFLCDLTTLNVRKVSHIHLFLQMHKTEDVPNGFLARMLPRRFDPEVRPDVFHVTIRHSDWRDWERDDPSI